MKILALHSSPNEDGLTAATVERAVSGAKAADAEVELVRLCDLEIAGCAQCDDGWGKCRREGDCTIEDDFQTIRAKCREADALIIATPVYFGQVSESAKRFLDRLRRCEIGTTRERKLVDKPVLTIAAAGGSGRGCVTCLFELERYCDHMGMRPFDLVTVTRFSRDHKLPALEQAGRRLVSFAQELP